MKIDIKRMPINMSTFQIFLITIFINLYMSSNRFMNNLKTVSTNAYSTVGLISASPNSKPRSTYLRFLT